MAKKLYTINTIDNYRELIYDPFTKPFGEQNPEIEIVNLMDDSLLRDTRTYNGITPAIARRMYFFAQAAVESGADGIIVTCTSVNMATALIKPLLKIPIINIEEPVAEIAVESGTRIGILATLPTSPDAIGRVVREKAQEKRKEIQIINSVANGAFETLSSGRRDLHDEMVCEALHELAKKVDVVAFAQISMSLIKHGDLPVPVFKIGNSGFERIKALMLKGENL